MEWDKILQENGDFLLQETGDYLLIEQKTFTQEIQAKASIKTIETKTIEAKAKIIIIVTQTQIIEAKAKIYLSQPFIDEIQKTVRQLQPKIEIQWDGITWTPESDYFISARGNEQLWKISGEGIAATLDVELDNTTERFTPDNIPTDWLDLNWLYRIEIIIDHTKVTGDSKTDFPIYFDLADAPAEFHNNVKSDGGDIRVTKSDGITEVPREVVSYDADNDVGELHFKGDLDADEDTVFYIYYGNSEANDYADDDTYGANNVWDTNYKLVSHMRDDPDNTAIKDSTVNANNGTKKGANQPTEADGKIGKGQDFDDDGAVGDYVSVCDSPPPSSLDMSNYPEITIEQWVNIQAWNTNVDAPEYGLSYVVIKRLGANEFVTQMYYLNPTTKDIRFQVWDSLNNSAGLATVAENLSTGVWYHFVCTFNLVTKACKWYKNGVLNSQATLAYTIGDNNSGLVLGSSGSSRHLDGILDEIRISNIARSADWILTEYNNQSSPSTFYSVGDEITQSDITLYQYLKPRVPIKVYVTAGGYDYQIFTGYIKNIHPDIRSRICSLECFDNQVLVYNKRANGIVYEDYRSDELLEVLTDLADLTSDQYSFDIGTHKVNFGYFEDRNVWPIMGEIAVAERGRIFFDRQGILTFWNRDRLHNKIAKTIIPDITLDDWIVDLDYSVAEHEIKNAVIVKATPRASAGVQVVWSSGNAEYLDPYSDTLVWIPAKGTQIAWLELEDPCTTFITPIANTDYTANSAQDGSGDDLTANISIHEFINYGNAVFINVQNLGDTDAYLTKFQVRGNPARVLKWIKVTATDLPSITRYGRQDFEIENNFIDSEDTAREIAQEELYRRKEAINLFRIDIIGIPHLLCGDVVNIEYRAGNYKNYMIDQLDWTFDDGGFMQRLTLVNPYIFPEIKTIDARGYIVDQLRTIQAKGKIS